VVFGSGYFQVFCFSRALNEGMFSRDLGKRESKNCVHGFEEFPLVVHVFSRGFRDCISVAEQELRW
jgi:hypothetical protein